MSQFADSLHEVFAALGRVQIRRMFGGHGVFHDGLMCGLVVRDTLYLKCDGPSAPHFDALALSPFSFERDGRSTAMSYRLAPESIFEDREAAATWTRRAFESALRAANAKPARTANRRASEASAARTAPRKTATKTVTAARAPASVSAARKASKKKAPPLR